MIAQSADNRCARGCSALRLPYTVHAVGILKTVPRQFCHFAQTPIVGADFDTEDMNPSF